MVQLDDGSRLEIASVHSLRWYQDASKQTSGLVSHPESNYGDHIIGYYPCGQSSGEWLYPETMGVSGRLPGLEPAALEGFSRYLTSKYGVSTRR